MPVIRCFMVKKGPEENLFGASIHNFTLKTMLRQVSNLLKNRLNQPLLFPSAFLHDVKVGEEIPPDVEAKRKADMPVELGLNPFEKEKPKCILCKYDVKLDYKNVRLLSQFVSAFSGKVYGRHVSGLCERQQKLLEKAVSKARRSGLMPHYNKDPTYLKDPQVFDPERPFRPHKY